MQDYLVQLGTYPAARKVAQNIGIPVPQKLSRAEDPSLERCLEGKTLLIGGTGHFHPSLSRSLSSSGAVLYVEKDASMTGGAYQGQLNVEIIDDKESSPDRAHALIFDASDLSTVEDLGVLYRFFHERIRSLSKEGRILVLGYRTQDAKSAEQSATRHALEGFVRSIAKEVGRKGATAQLIYVEETEAAKNRMDHAVLFFLSNRSSFITGQVITIDTKARGVSLGSLSKPLKGKVALVTGAARGIGAATAKILAAHGAQLVCLDRPDDEKPLSEVALAANGHILLQDIATPEAPKAIAKFLNDHFGGVDIVIHNAGITRDKTLAKMDQKQWDMTLSVNLQAVIEVTSELLVETLRDEGRIICLSSIAGIAGNFGQTNYAASKSGIIGYIEYMAKELGPRGITVNAIAPGFIETRLTEAIPFVTREAARRLSNLSQGGLPQDIAHAVTFLSSPGALGISGGVLRVCGGNLIGA